MAGLGGALSKLDEEMNDYLNFSFKEAKLPIIDLDLGMKRIYGGHKEEALECLRILLEAFKEDIPSLHGYLHFVDHSIA